MGRMHFIIFSSTFLILANTLATAAPAEFEKATGINTTEFQESTNVEVEEPSINETDAGLIDSGFNFISRVSSTLNGFISIYTKSNVENRIFLVINSVFLVGAAYEVIRIVTIG